jgi:hypothetical protein
MVDRNPAVKSVEDLEFVNTERKSIDARIAVDLGSVYTEGRSMFARNVAALVSVRMEG